MKDADTAELLMCHLCCRCIMFSGKHRGFWWWAACACVIDCWCCVNHIALISPGIREDSMWVRLQGENRGRRLMAKKSGGASQHLLYGLHQLFKKIKHDKTASCEQTLASSHCISYVVFAFSSLNSFVFYVFPVFVFECESLHLRISYSFCHFVILWLSKLCCGFFKCELFTVQNQVRG